MHVTRLFLPAIAFFAAATLGAFAAGRPEIHAFPFKTPVASAGDYAAARREFASFAKEDLMHEQVAEYVFKRAYSDYALLD